MNAQQRSLPPISAAVVVALIGLVGLYMASRQPAFDRIPAVLVLQLIASGMCFGGALGAIILHLRNRK